MITEPEEIRKRWKNYIEMLYDKKGKPLQDQMQVENESSVHEDFKGLEIMAAIREIKSNKANRVDDIPIEFWKRRKAWMNWLACAKRYMNKVCGQLISQEV